MGDGLEAVERASEVGKNIVVSAAALEVAKYLEKTFGTPYEIGYPAAGKLDSESGLSGKEDPCGTPAGDGGSNPAGNS